MTDFTLKSEQLPQVDALETGSYFELLKPRVMSLVIFTAFVGLVAAPGTLHPILALASITLIAIGAGASGALNMWYDADIDALMDRTASRPIPSGRVSRSEALTYGTALSVFSVVLLGLVANVTSAVLLAVTIVFYAVVYSMWLKRRTPQNIVIGGAAGAFPPMIGWAVVTDSVTLSSFVLFAIIFLWTPPHFWALALKLDRDYGRVSVPMLPNVAGEAATRVQIILYSLVLAPVTVLPWPLGFAGPVYGVTAIVAGLWFIYRSILVYRSVEGSEMGLFKYSIFYLFGLYGVLAGEKLINSLIV